MIFAPTLIVTFSDASSPDPEASVTVPASVAVCPPAPPPLVHAASENVSVSPKNAAIDFLNKLLLIVLFSFILCSFFCLLLYR